MFITIATSFYHIRKAIYKMIICITDRCRMNCSHCMNNCVYSDTNSFMNEKTFISSLKFVLDIIGCKLVVISGGEPTEHPDFVNYMYIANDYAKCYNAAIYICTNGMNFNDEHILEQIKEFESNGSNIMYQVTNDKRYYPVDVTNIITCASEKTHGFNRGMIACNISS